MQYTNGLGKQFYNFLKQKRKNIEKKDTDYYQIVIGKEGSGKSTLNIKSCLAFDPNFDVTQQVVFNSEQFRKIVVENNKGQAILIDEGHEVLYKRRAMTTETVNAIQAIKTTTRKRNQGVFINFVDIHDMDKNLWNRANVIILCVSRGKARIWSGTEPDNKGPDKIEELKEDLEDGKKLDETDVKPDGETRWKKFKENNKTWKKYLNRTEQLEQEENGSDRTERSSKNITEELKKDEDLLEDIIKNYKGNIHVDEDLLRAELEERVDKELTEKKNKEVKKLLERDIHLEKYT